MSLFIKFLLSNHSRASLFFSNPAASRSIRVMLYYQFKSICRGPNSLLHRLNEKSELLKKDSQKLDEILTIFSRIWSVVELCQFLWIETT